MIHGRDDLDQVWEAWERLAAGQSNFFATPDWNRLWLSHWRSEAAIIFLFHQGGRPAALIPLVLVQERRRGLPVRKLEILASPHLPEWLIDGAPGPILSRWLDELASLGDWEVLRLGAIRAQVAGLTELPDLLEDKGFQWREEPAGGAPIAVVDGDFNEFWNSRSQNLRKQVGKKWRQAERRGSLEFCVSQPGDDPDRWRQRLMAVAEKSWKADLGTSLAHGADHRFYPEALRLFLPQGQARIYMLRLDGQDIAYYLGFIRDETFFNLKTDYRSDFGELSPGIILLRPMMEHCFADPGLRRVNFLTTLPFNVRWATDVEPLRDITVAGPGLWAKAIWRAGRLRRVLSK